ncbi:MAG: hypothetical protein OEU26_23495 [Candidatus Tectomicrobia bacterium]|nr:hypothetical protein [Candidatus Tectomicrobia bacterium]
MPALFFAVLVLGIGTASVVVDRRLQARKQRAGIAPDTDAESSETTTTSVLSNWTSRLWSVPKSWTDRIIRTTPADMPQQFREWVVGAAGDDTAIKNWLNALSDEGLKAFTKHVATFCSDMGFELQWLVEKRFDKNPDLAQSVESIVLHYCRACLQSAEIQGDLEVYKQLLAYEEAPSSRQNRAFGEKLFAKVVEEGLVSASMSEYLGLSPKQRQERALEGIGEAAAKDNEVFIRAVRDVVRGEAGTSQTSEPTENGPQPTANDTTTP